jgi:hypothetical protein
MGSALPTHGWRGHTQSAASKEAAMAQLGDALAGARNAVAGLAALAEQCGPKGSRPEASVISRTLANIYT